MNAAVLYLCLSIIVRVSNCGDVHIHIGGTYNYGNMTGPINYGNMSNTNTGTGTFNVKDKDEDKKKDKPFLIWLAGLLSGRNAPQQDVVSVYQFPRASTVPSLSFHCLKVENYLKMKSIRYHNIEHDGSGGYLPVAVLNGHVIMGADQIIKILNSRFKDIDATLSDEQRNTTHELESMLNNQTSWMVRAWRYRYPNEFIESSVTNLQKSLGSKLSLIQFYTLLQDDFEGNSSSADERSVMSKSKEEIVKVIKGDLKVLSDLLGKKDYMFGQDPHQLDNSAFAHLAALAYYPIGDIKTWMETETPNLIALVDRIKAKWWPDWEEMTTSLELNTLSPKKEPTAEENEAQKKKEEKKSIKHLN